MGYTKEQLTLDLSALGLARGDAVYVHTSLKRVGWIDGGPCALLEAFLEALGPQGTLAVPTHSLSFPGFGKPPFDQSLSPGMTGAFPEIVRSHSGAYRSGHPSHSSAAIGAAAEFLTAGHCMNDPFAPDSPLYRLYSTGGKVLLLGVGQTANTSLHLAESIAEMPYVKLAYEPRWGDPYRIDESGATVSVPQTKFPGCSSHFGVMEGLFQFNNLIRYGLVGDAVCRLMDMKGIVDFTVGILKERPDFLLCHEPECPVCGRRRAVAIHFPI